MKYKKLILFLVLSINFFVANGQKSPADYVNVFTGTSNSRWMMFPGPSMPFGMVKFSPDNQNNVWNGGYEYTISSISGFSFLHSMALSGLSIMPVSGNLYANEGWLKSFQGSADGPFGGMWTAGYRSRFIKNTEHGSPGYYSVDLLDYQIKAELTSTMRCGILRLTYPQSKEAHLILNFDFPTEEKTEILETYFEKISSTEVKGYIRQKNNYVPDYTVYFDMKLSQPFSSADAWQGEDYTGADNNYGTQWREKRSVEKDVNRFHGKNKSGIVLNFSVDNKGAAVVVGTGISFVSMDEASLNLRTETGTFAFDFDKIAIANRSAWNKLLGKVEVFGSNENNKTKFYTNLYRCYTGKSVMNDVNGKYTDACQTTQELKGDARVVYSSDGLWGTQWDLTPLWTLLNPDIAASWVNSLLELSDKGGWIPSAPVALGYSPIMGAQHQNSLIISAYQKGIRDFNSEKAFNAILHDYTTPGKEYPCGGYAGDRHLKSYLQNGYVAEEAGPASSTMEYAYDDWCFAQFAKALGKIPTYDIFINRSKNYKNIFDNQLKFFRQKHEDGRWVKPFNAYKYGTIGGWNGKGFMEGTPFQYSFFVPQDVPALINIMGRDTFIKRLDLGFKNDLFDLGNEPCLQTPFLFNYAGKPWLTEKYTRKIVKEMYNTSPYQGWVGEEDEGQLSAYFVLLSMGLFEMDGGCGTEPYYNLTTPLFDKIVIHLDDHFYSGKTFTIITDHNKSGNDFIQSAKLNGKLINRAWIYHKEVVNGGILEFNAGGQPNKNWGLVPLPVIN